MPHSDSAVSDLKEKVHEAFSLWHKSDSAGSPLDHLFIYQAAYSDGEKSVRHATNRLLLHEIDEMAETHPAEAEILRLRFTEGHPAHFVANRLNLAEGTVWKKQREGIERITEMLLTREKEARAGFQSAWLARLEAPTYEQLFGVDASLRALLGQVVETEPPWLFSIEGIGGIGKTALTDALMRHLVETGEIGWGAFADMGWVTARQSILNAGGSLRLVEQPALTANALIDALADQLMPEAKSTGSDPERLLPLLRERLKERPHLIVVDNLETLIDVEALLETLRSLAGPTRFLLTTRESLFHESDIFHVRVPELEEPDALRLVRREAERRNLPDLAGAGDADLRPIFETVGGNPLALRLVVGQTHVHALHDVLADLAAARGETVAGLYNYIYRRAWENLNEDARRVLLLMPLISEEGGDLEYLVSMGGMDVGELRGALDQLVRLNLVDRRGDLHHSRYTIHSLTRTFLQEQVLHWNPLDDEEA